MIQRFEDIIAWQKAQELATDVYKVLYELKDRDFKNQICRAAVSISNNIAEGFERNSRPQFNHFLDISLGSCGEVRSMLHLSVKLNYIQKTTAMELIEKAS